MPRGTPRNGLDLPPNLKSLSLHPTSTPALPPDSWEEEALTPPSSPSSASSTPGQSHATKPENEDTESIPSAPPPTPISPTYRTSTTATKTNVTRNLDNIAWDNPYGAPTSPTSPRGPTNAGVGNGVARPEKSAAVAGRMIAAGLGVRQPKKSEENKAYEKAVREKEKKKREKERMEEKERAEEVERTKKSVWEG